jgi:hypothetical protein
VRVLPKPCPTLSSVALSRRNIGCPDYTGESETTSASDAALLCCIQILNRFLHRMFAWRAGDIDAS